MQRRGTMRPRILNPAHPLAASVLDRASLASQLSRAGVQPSRPRASIRRPLPPPVRGVVAGELRRTLQVPPALPRTAAACRVALPHSRECSMRCAEGIVVQRLQGRRSAHVNGQWVIELCWPYRVPRWGTGSGSKAAVVPVARHHHNWAWAIRLFSEVPRAALPGEAVREAGRQPPQRLGWTGASDRRLALIWRPI